MRAADEIAKLEAMVGSLQVQMDEATRVIGQQSLVLADYSRRLTLIEKGSIPPAPPPGPSPVPVPPPAPAPTPAPDPQRSAADVTAIIQAEFAAATTYRLNASQLAAWVKYFMDPAMSVLAAEPFRTAVRAMVEKDIKQYNWPRVGAPADAANTFHIIVSGESS